MEHHGDHGQSDGPAACGDAAGDEAAALASRESPVVDAAEAAAYLKISRAHFYKLVKSGRAPGPIRLGRATRWLRQELDEWLAAGAPPRVKWEQTKAARRKT